MEAGQNDFGQRLKNARAASGRPSARGAGQVQNEGVWEDKIEQQTRGRADPVPAMPCGASGRLRPGGREAVGRLSQFPLGLRRPTYRDRCGWEGALYVDADRGRRGRNTAFSWLPFRVWSGCLCKQVVLSDETLLFWGDCKFSKDRFTIQIREDNLWNGAYSKLIFTRVE